MCMYIFYKHTEYQAFIFSRFVDVLWIHNVRKKLELHLAMGDQYPRLTQCFWASKSVYPTQDLYPFSCFFTVEQR